MSDDADVVLPPFVVFGEALTDFVRLDDCSWKSAAGGACWNVARVASTLGLRTGWGGAVSDDFFGHEIVEKSLAARLDMRFLQTVSKPPFLAIVHQQSPPQYFFLGNGTADLEFDEQLLPEGWKDACKIAHFGCLGLVRQPLGERLVKLAEELRQRGVEISYDPNYRNLMGDDFPAQFERMAKIAKIIKISDEDLGHIYPGQDADVSLSRVRELAPEALVLYTRGDRGITLYKPAETLEQPAMQVQVGDTVGAGDACIGGFIFSLLAKPTSNDAEHLRFAAATAAAACTKVGAHAPTRCEVNALLRD